MCIRVYEIICDIQYKISVYEVISDIQYNAEKNGEYLKYRDIIYTLIFSNDYCVVLLITNILPLNKDVIFDYLTHSYIMQVYTMCIFYYMEEPK